MAIRHYKKISELPALTPATMDSTFIVGISGSTTYKISVNQLTSSLDSQFASDLVTNALSNSLDTKLSTASFNQYTGSISTASLVTSINNLNSATSSYLVSLNGAISSSSQLTSSYDERYVLSGSITQTTWNNISGKPNGLVSQSTDLTPLNNFTASISTASLVTSISNLNTFTASQSTASLVTSINNLNSATSSYETKGSGILSGSVSYTSLTNIPSGIVSGSSQILGGSGVYSSSAQLPSGLISGSSQLTSSLATIGSNSFNGNQTITGSIVASSNIQTINGYVDTSLLYHGGGIEIRSFYQPLQLNSNGAGVIVNDNIQITGSLSVSGSITGSTNFNTIVNKPTLISGSSQLTSSYDQRYVLSGSITQTTWDNIASKPNDIISSSQQISDLGFITNIPIPTYISSGETAPGTAVVTNDTNVDVNFSGVGTQFSFEQDGLIYPDGIKQNIAFTGIPEGTISGSQQINDLGFVTGSYAYLTEFNSLTQSFNIISGSVVNITNAVDVTQLNNTTASLNSFTQSANIRLNNLESNTGSYETTGRGILSGSISYNSLTNIPQGLISSSTQLPAGTISGSAQITALGFISTSVDLTSLNNFTSSYNTGSFTGSFSGSFKGNLNGTAAYSDLIKILNASSDTNYAMVFTTAGSNGYLTPYTDAFSGSYWNPSTNRMTISGSMIVTSGITGSIAATNGVISSSTQIDALGYTTTASFNSYTASQSTASLVTSITNLNTFTASVSTASLVTSISNLNTLTSSLATTGSNTFNGNQTISGSLNLTGSIMIGSGAFDGTAPEKLLINQSGSSYNSVAIKTNVNNYSQLYITNLSNGISASSDIVVQADNGTQTNMFADLGVNSSGYTGNGNGVGYANDAYVYGKAKDFWVGNNTTGSLYIFANTASVPDISLKNKVLSITGSMILTGSFTYNGTTLSTGFGFSQPKVTKILNNASYTGSGAWTTSYNGSGGAIVVTADSTGYRSSSGLGTVQLLRDSVVVASQTYYFNLTNTHMTLPSVTYVSNSDTGSHTYAVNFSNILVDANDYATIVVSETTSSAVINVPGSNNQLLTSDGANGLVAESTLTYDGSTLKAQYVESTNSSGDEGGEYHLAISQTNTSLTGSYIVLDSWQNKVRFFEGGGNARGVSIDLSKAPNSVGGELLWKASGIVNAGTFVTLDNIKATLTSSGNRGLSLATTTGTITATLAATYAVNGGAGGSSSNGTITVNTSASTSHFSWNFAGQGDLSTYLLNDITNSRVYRITLVIGGGYLNNFISIERLY